MAKTTDFNILWRVGTQFDDDGNQTAYFQVVSEDTLNCLAANLDEAAASKIVTALNSHAALVEALEAAKDELADQHDRQVSIGDEPNIAESLFEKIDATLTLAKGA